MINTTLCYISRGEDYLMLHRVKKENDLTNDKWIALGESSRTRRAPRTACCGRQRRRPV